MRPVRPVAVAAATALAVVVAVAGCSGGVDETTAAGPPSSSTTTVVAPATAPTTTVPAPPSGPPTTAAAAPAPTGPTASGPPTPPSTPPPPTDARITTVTAEDLFASWRPGCPVGPEDLRRVAVAFVDFEGVERTGAIIVRADWAEAVLATFDRLHDLGYPIERVEPVDAFGGSDDASMAVNNTSGFNCRPVTGGTAFSRHAYGTAIDLDPRQNPYVTADGEVLPPEGVEHLDRSPAPGRILPGDDVVAAFADMGWRWGGDFTDPVDYQHFDIRP